MNVSYTTGGWKYEQERAIIAQQKFNDAFVSIFPTDTYTKIGDKFTVSIINPFFGIN